MHDLMSNPTLSKLVNCKLKGALSMSRHSKKLVSMFLSISLLVSVFSLSASAATFGESKAFTKTVLEKQQLVDYALQKEASKKAKVKIAADEIDKMIGDILTSTATEAEKDTRLEAIGVYRLKTAQKSSTLSETISPLSSSSSATVSAPSVMFDSGNNGWVVGANVNWAGGWDMMEGGEEAYGVHFYNLSGPTSSLAVQSTYSAMYDQNYGNVNYSYSRISGSPSYGFGYKAQDRILYYDSIYYVGSKIYYSARYNNAFGLCHGLAQGFYHHTWSSCGISSVSLSYSPKNLGVNITFTSSNNHFGIASLTDTIF